jgi:NAD(P)-dependent dehydrogenase (short-subunit alcohol dehydrogenase family)
MKLKPINEQVVVVFGASSGIGRQAALNFAARGAKVVAAARGEAGLHSLVEEILSEGGQAFYVVADTANYEQVENVARECVRCYGRIDTWVHAAGVIQFARFEDTTPDEFKQIIDINLLGQIYGAHVAMPHLKKQGGALIHISSVEAIRAAPLQSAYGASKHGISGFLESLRAELIHEKVNVSVTEIMPAVINSPIWETGRNKTGKKIQGPLPPAYHPKVVADAILYAAENPIRDMVAGTVGVAVRYSERISPELADYFTSWVAYRQVGTEPADPDAVDNLFQPVTESDRIEGRLEGWKTDVDPFMWVRTRRPAVKRAIAAGGALAAFGLFRFLRRGA